MILIVDLFGSQYNTISDTYNQSIATGTADPSVFAADFDGLVAATRAVLQETLTPEGLEILDSRVQQEKSRMTVPAEVQP